MPEQAAVGRQYGKTLFGSLLPGFDVTDAGNIPVIRLNAASIGGTGCFPQFGGQLDLVAPIGEMAVGDDVPIISARIDVVIAASDDEQKDFAEYIAAKSFVLGFEGEDTFASFDAIAHIKFGCSFFSISLASWACLEASSISFRRRSPSKVVSIARLNTS